MVIRLSSAAADMGRPGKTGGAAIQLRAGDRRRLTSLHSRSRTAQVLQEPEDRLVRGGRVLVRRQVARLGDHLEPGVGDRRGDRAGLRRGGDHVVLADHHERRDRDPGQVAAPVGPDGHAPQGPGDALRRGLLHHRAAAARPARDASPGSSCRRGAGPSSRRSAGVALAASTARAVSSRALGRLGRVGRGAGVDQHQAADPLGMAQHQRQRHVSAHRQAAQDDRARRCPGDRAARRRRRPSRPSCKRPRDAADSPWPRRSGAITRYVEPIAVELLLPHRAAERKPVQQDHDRPGSACLYMPAASAFSIEDDQIPEEDDAHCNAISAARTRD